MRIVLPLLTLGLAATASLAMADRTQKSDARGDHNGGPFDLRSATVGHAGRDVVKHRVRGWKAGGVKSLRLEIGGTSGRPSFFVAKLGRKAGMYQYTEEGPKRRGPAKLTKHSKKSYSFKFDMEIFGHPTRYGWRWIVVTPDKPNGADKLPNSGVVTHNLATGRD
ncbi:MAG TPA: hypothetical protein VD790_12110 [Thermoleophilaceae bacterium]|nr:hypothetical protein [Thermoleophilaceae bacterium]